MRNGDVKMVRWELTMIGASDWCVINTMKISFMCCIRFFESNHQNRVNIAVKVL
jgi:hypothetical protein